MSITKRLSEIDSGLASVATVWLSGILTGELIIVFALSTSREFRGLSGPTDWVVASVLAVLSIGIFVIAFLEEYRGE